MDAVTVFENVQQTAAQFAVERRQRQQRRSLVAADFAQLKEAGFHLTGVPIDQGASGKACARLPARFVTRCACLPTAIRRSPWFALCIQPC